ncbi:hypothetical protein CHPC933_0020 [Streptococcus phage CHPC933]|nr:hypothetical protein CHPC933_0020 [Streptococcus phage CHPC933]
MLDIIWMNVLAFCTTFRAAVLESDKETPVKVGFMLTGTLAVSVADCVPIMVPSE